MSDSRTKDVHVKQQPSVNLPPKDRFHLAYIIFFILGLGVLFPWNLLINAQSYFSLIFAGSNFSENFSNSFGVSFFVSEVVFMSLITAFQGFSFGMRIQGALALNAVVFVVLAALTFITLDPVLSFQLHIAMVILCGACTAILQNGVFCLVSLFPPVYVQSLIMGQGAAAVILSVAMVVSLLIGDGRPRESAHVYFLFAVLIIFICLSVYWILAQLSIFRHYLSASVFFPPVPCEQSDLEANRKSGEFDCLLEENERASQPHPISASLPLIPEETGDNVKSDLFKMSPYLFMIFYTLFITLSLFPAHASTIISTNTSYVPGHLFTSIGFLMFSLGDWVGRMMPTMRFRPSTGTLLFLCLSYTIFVPIFFSVTLKHQGFLPVIIGNDIVVWLILFLFALSNGFISTWVMMLGPYCVDVNSREKAASWLILAMMYGLLFGSAFSFAIRSSLCNFCNPFIN